MDEESHQQTVKDGGVLIPRELYATLPRAFHIGWDALSGPQQQQILRVSSPQNAAASDSTSSQRRRKKPRREQHAAAAAVVPVVVGNTKNNAWFSSLPQSCITNIFNFAAAGPEDVMDTLSFISKQSRKDCLHESIVQKIVPTIYLSSRRAKQRDEANQNREQRRGSLCGANESEAESEVYALLEMTTRTMLQKLKNRQFLMGNDKAQSHYERMELTGLEEFGCIKLSEVVTMTNDLSFEGVISLDLPSPSAVNPQVIDYVHSREHVSFPTAILSMLPCLLEMNLTNTKWESYYANSFPCSNCFEKLTWNGRRQEYDAATPTIPNIKNIKEIYMDDYLFLAGPSIGYYKPYCTLWDTEKVSKKRMTIFSNFRSAKKLERLSIRNVRYQCNRPPEPTILFPQQALIKFVRNTLPPNVRWLRSDLSKANIASLQLDYPQIEFVKN